MYPTTPEAAVSPRFRSALPRVSEIKLASLFGGETG